MAYSVLADVQSEFKGVVFTPTTTPSDATVNTFISQADVEIDARIGLRYSVPVDTIKCPIAAMTLKRLSVWLAAARVKEVLKVKSADSAVSQEARAGDPAKIARDQLTQIATGQYLLSDAPLVNSIEGMSSFGYSNGETLTFDKNADQW